MPLEVLCHSHGLWWALPEQNQTGPTEINVDYTVNTVFELIIALGRVLKPTKNPLIRSVTSLKLSSISWLRTTRKSHPGNQTFIWSYPPRIAYISITENISSGEQSQSLPIFRPSANYMHVSEQLVLMAARASYSRVFKSIGFRFLTLISQICKHEGTYVQGFNLRLTIGSRANLIPGQ